MPRPNLISFFNFLFVVLLFIVSDLFVCRLIFQKKSKEKLLFTPTLNLLNSTKILLRFFYKN